MAVFSDLPNELIVEIWGHVIEPEAVESFAQVSKKIYSFSAPFVREHAYLKQQYSQIRFSYRNEPAHLLGKILLNPRIAFYISDLHIPQLALLGTPQAFSKDTMAAFEHAIHASPLIASWEAEYWVTDIMKGNEDPIIALIVMQLTKMETFILCKSISGKDRYLLTTLERIIKSSELTQLGQLKKSVVATKVDGHAHDDSSATSAFSTVRVMGILGDFRLEMISRLLRNTKELKTFAYSRSFCYSFEIIHLCNELIKCSQHSLQRLFINEKSAAPGQMGDLTHFKMLAELNVNFVLLFNSMIEAHGDLAEVLPVSIERVTLSLIKTSIASEVLKKVILEIIKSKMEERLPNLQALAFEFGGFSNSVTDDNMTLINELEGVSAEAGVRLSAIGYPITASSV